MNRCRALAVLALCLASGVLSAQVPLDPPPLRPPQNDPSVPPAGLPQLPPGGPGAVPGGPGGFPGFPMQADHKELVSALVDLIDDADAEVRAASVAQALGKIGRQAVNPVLDILKNKEKSASVRANAAYILGQIGPQAQEALPTLTKALKETDKDLRKRAAFAIAHIVGNEFGAQGFAPGIFGPAGIGGGVRAPGQGVPPRLADPGVVGPDIKKIPDPKPLDPEKKPN